MTKLRRQLIRALLWFILAVDGAFLLFVAILVVRNG
jgi:hypothetical protein